MERGCPRGMDDSKLIQDLKQRRRQALDRVFSRYSGYAASVAGSILGKTAREDLEEIVSDVFLALWRAADRLDENRQSLKGFIATAARNAAIDRLRRQKPEHPLPDEEILPADETAGPEAVAIRKEQAEIMRGLLLAMPEEDREIFIRFYYFRQTVREIAAITGRKEPTVKSRLIRGRKALREQLLQKGIDGYEN